MFFRLLRAFARNQRGTVSIVSALALPALVGFGALVAEYGHGLTTRTQNQRIADLAAYAGGLAYLPNQSTTAMVAAAKSVAAMNGIPASQISVALVTSPRTASNQAVQATIATTQTLLLAPVLGSGRTLSVTAQADAEISKGSSAPSCILALSGSGTGVTLSGGTKISAPACSVNSNNTVSVPCGTAISAKSVTYNSSAAPSQPCSGITGPVTKAATSDPLAGNAGVQAATARLSTVSAMTAPTMAGFKAGTDITFAYDTTATTAAAADGCTASAPAYSGNWTVTCPSGGTYYFGNITVSGGVTVNFNTGGSSSNKYYFSGSITNSGNSLTFGPGTYYIAKGLTTSQPTTFGAGTFNIGQSASACSGGGEYSICNTSTLTFGGPSTFVLTAGLYNGGGSTLTFGSGTTNSFNIGPSSDGNAFYLGGRSMTFLGDATGSSSVFQVVGNVNVVSGGGSCLTLSAAAQHDIDGFFSTAGGTTLGAGVYTVNSYIALGANGGGDVSCNGATVGVNGSGVTLVTGASSTLLSGSCASSGFCVAAGYSNVTLTAPTSGATANLVVVGPTSARNSASAIFAEGASNTNLSGAFYFPNGPIGLSGGSSVGGGTAQCLQLIGSQVTLSGGTAAASACIGGATSASSTVALVQ